MADSPLDRLVADVRHRLGTVFKGREEFDLTSGGIARPLFYLSLPIVITNLLQTAYNLVDTIWLGQYSDEALAAIGMAFPLVFFLISLGLGISIAGSILVAQNVGAGDEPQAEFAASQTVTFAVAASFVLGALGYVGVGDLLRLIGGPENVVEGATAYLEIIALGMPFMFAFFVFMSLMRGYGDTITPMLVMFVTVVFNMVLDPILIFGWGTAPELGILGAAYATIASRALATVVGLWIMFEGSRGVQIHLDQMVPDLGYLRKIVRVGVPASVENTGNSIAVVLMLTIVTPFGEAVIAAYTVGVRLFSVIFLPAIAVGQGVETMAGQNIGAGEEDRAATTSRFAGGTMFALLTVMGILTWFSAGGIVRIFTGNPEVIEIGRLFLRYVALTFGFTGIFHAFKGGFRGAGRTLTAAAISITMLGAIRLPVAYLGSRSLAFEGTPVADLVAAIPIAVVRGFVRAPIETVMTTSLGYEGIWLGFAVANVAGAVIAYAWYRRGTWRGADLTGGPAGGPMPPEAEDPDPTPTDD